MAGPSPRRSPERGAGRPKPQRGRGQAAAGGSGPGEEVPRPRGPDAASRARGAPLAGAGRRRPPSRPLPAPRRLETAGQGAGRAFPRSAGGAGAAALARGRARGPCAARSGAAGGRARSGVLAHGAVHLGGLSGPRASSHTLVHALQAHTCSHMLTHARALMHTCSQAALCTSACSHTPHVSLSVLCTLAHTRAVLHTSAHPLAFIPTPVHGSARLGTCSHQGRPVGRRARARPQRLLHTRAQAAPTCCTRTQPRAEAGTARSQGPARDLFTKPAVQIRKGDGDPRPVQPGSYYFSEMRLVLRLW